MGNVFLLLGLIALFVALLDCWSRRRDHQTHN
jgi:hypothetical protein